MNPYSKPIDNLSVFTHPVFGEKFRYMTDREGVALAQRVLEKFIASGYKTIVIIESGTSPVIQIMRQLQAFKRVDFNLVQLKIPRDTNFNLLAWFTQYLSDEELHKTMHIDGKKVARRQALASECGKPILQQLTPEGQFSVYDSINNQQTYNDGVAEKIRKILKGTSLSTIFNQPFLLFDEYINSGTVLRSFNTMARLFAEQPTYQVSAFCAFVDDATKYEKIAFTLYDNRTELACYQHGAYPYENRIDIIGYYYFVAAKTFEKINLTSLLGEIAAQPHGDPEVFYNRMMQIIQKSGATDALKNALSETQVRAYVSNNDIARFLLKQLEHETFGQTKYWDLLDQAFELYAPAWSPMPVKNHLDYWNGFADIGNQMKELTKKLQAEYKIHRNDILHNLLQQLTTAKKAWDANIHHIIKEENL